MSYTTIYFLTEAKDMEEAEHQVTDYLEGEHFFDYFNFLRDESGTLEEKRAELDGIIHDRDWKRTADDLLEQAERYKTAGNMSLYGHCLRKAGQLYAQDLGIDTCVYNIDTGDYYVPSDDKDCWVVAVDFHH